MGNIKFLSIAYILEFMLPHLTTLSKTFQTGELIFSQINPAIERALFIIKEIDDEDTPLESLKKDLSGRLL